MTIREDIIEEATAELRLRGYEPVANEVREELEKVVTEIELDLPSDSASTAPSADELLDGEEFDVPSVMAEAFASFRSCVTVLVIGRLTPFEAFDKDFDEAAKQHPGPASPEQLRKWMEKLPDLRRGFDERN